MHYELRFIILLCLSFILSSCVKNGYVELQDKKIDDLNEKVKDLEIKIEKLEEKNDKDLPYIKAKLDTILNNTKNIK